MKIKEFKIRSSQSAKILCNRGGLTNKQEEELKTLLEKGSKAKKVGELQFKKKEGPSLTAGGKTYCREWLQEQVYDRRRDIKSKYLQKGNVCEDPAIAFYGMVNLVQVQKNEEYRENDYITGTCDVLVGNDKIVDTKCSYDHMTFPLFVDDIDKGYRYQLNSYGKLWDRKKLGLCYALMSAPEWLIEQEARSASYRFENKGKDILELESYYRNLLQYDDVPNSLRLKEYEFEYCEEMNAHVEQSVKLCRIYIQELIKKQGIDKI